MTDEIKNDLAVLQMRSVLDPKHFYKKNDLKVPPKYFQVKLNRKFNCDDVEPFFVVYRLEKCWIHLWISIIIV